MTGLDKILEKIQQETQREEEKILSAAQQQSEEFREKAERQLALELNQKRSSSKRKSNFYNPPLSVPPIKREKTYCFRFEGS